MSGRRPPVQRMEGVDAGYLYMETPTMHMHTLKVAILDPAEPFDFARFTERLLERLDRLPPMHRRVQPVPLQLNHPLWEMHVCEGLADGRIAVVAKLHHALADGAAANALLGNVTDAREGSAASVPLVPGAVPGRRTQVLLALGDAIRQLFLLPALLLKTASALAAVVRHRRRSSVSVPKPVLDVPRVSFNGPLTAERVFATASLPFEELREVRARYGVTVNDTVLAVVAGALRRWMDARGEHPRGSLVAAVPVATDAPDADPRLGGNRVSNLFTSLATDIDDPVERLRTIARTTSESKVIQRTLGPDMLIDWVQYAPPGPFSAAMRWYSRSKAASRHPAPINAIVSNVPGPREAVTIAGTELVDLFSVGPILEGIGLNITAWSYVDRMNFSLLSCPALVDDLGSLAAQLRPALDELRDASEG